MPELKGAFLRVDRAKEHLRDFLSVQESHRLDQNPSVTIHPHPALGYRPEVEAAGPPPPFIASILAGEAIYNLRAALDYLIFELADLDSGREQGGTQFPIEDTEDGFRRRRTTFLKGVNDEHVAFIEVLQPYKRTYWTQILRDISNPDKHRKLITTEHRPVGNVYVEHGPKGSFVGRTNGRVYEAPDDPSIDVYVEADITIHISFEDIRPVEDVLNDLVSQIRATLLEFEPCFAGDCGHSPPETMGLAE